METEVNSINNFSIVRLKNEQTYNLPKTTKFLKTDFNLNIVNSFH